MTTMVTVETHSWPVKVTTVDRYTLNHGEPNEQTVVTIAEETVQPSGKRAFHLTNSRSIAFDELPIPEGATST